MTKYYEVTFDFQYEELITVNPHDEEDEYKTRQCGGTAMFTVEEQTREQPSESYLTIEIDRKVPSGVYEDIEDFLWEQWADNPNQTYFTNF
jgi:single-stranded DNA-specific DHH superfamily exonuclease